MKTGGCCGIGLVKGPFDLEQDQHRIDLIRAPLLATHTAPTAYRVRANPERQSLSGWLTPL